MKIKSHTLSAIIILFSITPANLTGQENEAKVKHTSASTADGQLFSAWVTRQQIELGQDIIVYYRVDNQSRKPIYLVRDPRATMVIEDDKIIFPRPLVLIGTHEAYDYSFIKVAAGDSYRGKLIVPSNQYKIAQEWTVEVGFGYVTSIKGLNPRPEEIDDPAHFKALLDSRLQTLELSKLIIEVKGR